MDNVDRLNYFHFVLRSLRNIPFAGVFCYASVNETDCAHKASIPCGFIILISSWSSNVRNLVASNVSFSTV